MTVKVIAMLALLILALGVSLANYWFTFGLWPKSWTSFVLCWLASITVMKLVEIVAKSDE